MKELKELCEAYDEFFKFGPDKWEEMIQATDRLVTAIRKIKKIESTKAYTGPKSKEFWSKIYSSKHNSDQFKKLYYQAMCLVNAENKMFEMLEKAENEQNQGS